LYEVFFSHVDLVDGAVQLASLYTNILFLS
jgi:hypothetical protein